MTQTLSWDSASPEQTLRLGRLIGELIEPRDVLALYGPLGAGKTQLVKGIAAGLGVSQDEPVVSPTFVLVREYAGRLTLYHLDAYRLQGADDLAAIGWDEMLEDPQGAVVLEWADRVESALPAAFWRIDLAYAGPRERSVTIIPPDATRAAALAQHLGV